jgi:membrane protease YdiL (CAAX protease family)
MWLRLIEMFKNKINWFKMENKSNTFKWYEKDPFEKVPLILPFLLFMLIPLRYYIEFRDFSIHPSLKSIRIIEIVLFEGVTEEIVFRGFLLNALLKKVKLFFAIIINQIMFLIIHFPIWIYFKFSIILYIENIFSKL